MPGRRATVPPLSFASAGLGWPLNARTLRAGLPRRPHHVERVEARTVTDDGTGTINRSEGSERKGPRVRGPRGPSKNGESASGSEGLKRSARMAEFTAQVRQDSEAWRAASDAAAVMRDAIFEFACAVGHTVAADMLAGWADALRRTQRTVQRRKSAQLPTITGRKPRNEGSDMFWKGQLLNPPRGPNGRRLSVTDLAHQFAERRGISFDAARRHLSRLKREARLEVASVSSFDAADAHEQPNVLARLAGIRRPKSET